MSAGWGSGSRVLRSHSVGQTPFTLFWCRRSVWLSRLVVLGGALKKNMLAQRLEGEMLASSCFVWALQMSSKCYCWLNLLLREKTGWAFKPGARSQEPDPAPTPCIARGRGPALSSPVYSIWSQQGWVSSPSLSAGAPGTFIHLQCPLCLFSVLLWLSLTSPSSSGSWFFFFFFALSFFHLLSFKNTHWQRLGQAYLHWGISGW